MEISFINVGYGESILITADDPSCAEGRFVMLIDGGSSMEIECTGNSGRIRAADFIRKKGIRHIDIMVFTHVHEDHVSGLPPVIEALPVGEYWASVELDPSRYGKKIEPGPGFSETNCKALYSINVYCELMEKLAGKNIHWLWGIHPDYFRKGDLSIDILGPEENYKRSVEAALDRIFDGETDAIRNDAVTETTESMNNASLILRLHYKGKTVLLCGDTNSAGFDHVLRTDPELLKADVYKIGHHGQADSVSEKLVKAVDPSVIVCCASNDHRNNSSNEKTFETIRRALGDKVTYLFHDGCYNAQWNPETSPRNGVEVDIDEKGITWQLC